jgi:NifU-like protein involved in Fe-S cluster formation
MEGLAELYSRRILELASSIPHTTPLVHPQARVLKHSRLCGSSIEVCVVMSVETTGIRERKPWLKDNFRVTEFSQDVKACVFGHI